MSWVVQQLREAMPYGVQPHYLFRDNDGISRADRSGVAHFSATLSRILLADAQDDEGLTDDDIVGKRVEIPVTISLGGTAYFVEAPGLYSAKAGRKGLAKGLVT